MKYTQKNEVGSPLGGDVHPKRSADRSTRITWFGMILSTVCLLMATGLRAEPVQVRVTVENLMPDNGSLITPLWVGFHEGGYDFFDAGSPASMALERLAEDGNPSGLSELFLASGEKGLDGVLNALGPIPPGAMTGMDFFLDDSNAAHRFFSYAAMVIPSNDAFIGNDASDGYPLFDEMGQFQNLELMLTRSMVYDAGVETNDELPENTPALGQITPNTGTDEQGVIRIHSGHMAMGAGGIVDRDAFANADFTHIETPLVRITVMQVAPKPVDLVLQIENQAPEKGVFFTPVWMGFHDGSVRTFEMGQTASGALERMAEDGDPSALNEWFMNLSGAGMHHLVTSELNPPVFAPGTSRDVTIRLNANDPRHQFVSFVSMVIPSNDAFVGNMEPIQVFDELGNLVLNSVKLGGSTVWDAGTEQNTELPEATPLLGQMVANTGPEEGGEVRVHAGFNAPGMGGILDNPMFMQADFKRLDYPLLALNAQWALRITSLNRGHDEWTLQWAGGNPPYQVQMKSSADMTDWSNVGMPTSDLMASVPSGDAEGFFRVVSLGDTANTSTAKYRLIFNATWSAETHPDMFPGNPHFSGLIGATHNSSGQFWEPGRLASAGIESMAETGSKFPLQHEIQEAINAGWAYVLISGGGIGFSPGSVSVEFEVSAAHSKMSLVSMIAPSPDWFVGVHGLELRPGGQWIDSLTVELAPYDSGTDSGTTYTSPNAEPVMHDPITALVSAPVIHEGRLPPFGDFVIKRLE